MDLFGKETQDLKFYLIFSQQDNYKKHEMLKPRKLMKVVNVYVVMLKVFVVPPKMLKTIIFL